MILKNIFYSPVGIYYHNPLPGGNLVIFKVRIKSEELKEIELKPQFRCIIKIKKSLKLMSTKSW